jgi:hypothetical protein
LQTWPSLSENAAVTVERNELDELRALVDELLERSTQLQTALDSRVVIEQAKGILSERLGIGMDDAFRVLRRAARNSRARIHVLAAQVIAGSETPAVILEAARAEEPELRPGDVDHARRSDMRIAENEALFRRVNEQLRRVERPLGPERCMQFLCECGDPSCTDFVNMSVHDYEGVRSDARRFFVLKGHEEGWVERVLERRDGYLVVEKMMPTATMAEETDPRRDG